MKNWIIILSAAFLFFSGCQKDEAIIPMDELAYTTPGIPEVWIGTEFTMFHTGTVKVEPDGFTIHFANVEEDTRCPTDVDCIWEGRALIKLLLKKDKESHEILLETPNNREEYGQEANVFGRSVHLLQVTPQTAIDNPITLEKYRLRMVVKNQSRSLNGS